ncbi:MAG: hypothetical protein WC533_01090 [Candidatus Pacearchaeota archaeon]
MLNKRGQFYLIAAIIIIIIVLGIVKTTNYILVKKEKGEVNKLNKEVNLEIMAVSQYGIINGKDLKPEYERFGEIYCKSYQDYEFFFVYGNKLGDVFVMQCQEEVSTDISLIFGGNAPTNLILESNEFIIIPGEVTHQSGDSLVVEVLNTTYTINKSGDEIFYFVVQAKQIE